MPKLAANAFIGYSFQNKIGCYFVFMMDYHREMQKVEIERISEPDDKFDDITIYDNDNIYKIQVKNYKNLTLDKIKIGNNIIKILDKCIQLLENKKMVVIYHSSEVIESNYNFYGLPAIKQGNVIIIPIDDTKIVTILDNLKYPDERILEITRFYDKQIHKRNLKIELKDLPPIQLFSTDLLDKTIYFDKSYLNEFNAYINFVVGEPGKGKSHVCSMIEKTLKEKNRESVLYRFWINNTDPDYDARLHYENFLEDIGRQLTHTYQICSEEEIIDLLAKKQCVLLIDGLDHLERYGKSEDFKSFMKLIEQLEQHHIQAIIFSRPLALKIKYKQYQMQNWLIDDVYKFLNEIYNITDWSICYQIYEISQGYPLITKYIAEDYKKNNKVSDIDKLNSLDEYYSSVVDSKLSISLNVFLCNNSFYTYEELSNILQNEYKYIKEFIDKYPYFFTYLLNRVSLFHDSFNTYLRERCNDKTELINMQNKVSTYVKGSVLQGNINFISRLNHFKLGTEFIKELIKKYSSFTALKDLLNNTLDIESIKEFYNYLRIQLEYTEKVLDIYEYYTFVLIYNTLDRVDLEGYENLVYNLLLYQQKSLSKENNLEDTVYSQGVMWNILYEIKSNIILMQETNYNIYIESLLIDIETHQEKIEDILSRLMYNNIYSYDILDNYLISLNFLHKSNNIYYREFQKYIDNDNTYFHALIDKNKIDKLFSGKLRIIKNNIDMIAPNHIIDWNEPFLHKLQAWSHLRSYKVLHLANNLIRLAYLLNKDIDIYALNYAWIMYFFRKDYTVINIYRALDLFEQKKQVHCHTSFEILKSFMERSEKGIRHIFTSYLINKDTKFWEDNINQIRKYMDYIRIDELKPEQLKYFNVDEVLHQVRRSVGSAIRYDDIVNIMYSIHKESLIILLTIHKFEVIEVDKSDKEFIKELDKHNILYTLHEDNKNYIDEDNQTYKYLKESNLKYYIDNGYLAEQVADMVDGNLCCLPYPEIFGYFKDINWNDEYMHILHRSLYSKTEYIDINGLWFGLLSNILEFLNIIDVNVKWDKLYNIFNEFVYLSLLLHLDKNSYKSI